MTSSIDEQPQLEMGKNWDYLGSIHYAYVQMVQAKQQFFESYKKGQAHGTPLIRFVAAISTYRDFVVANYAPRDESGLKVADYDNLETKNITDINVDKLIKLYRELVYWSQVDGPFHLMNEKNDPGSAFL
jgi:hypothetical protein